MSFARGFQTGWSAVSEAQEKREKRKLREGLKRAGALEQETVAGGKRQATPEEFARAQDYTQRIAAQDAATFGPDLEAEMGEAEMGAYAPAAPSGLVRPTQYQLGGRTQGTQFSPEEVNRARTEEMARVYEQQGMPEEAMRMRQLAQQQELSGLQLGQARRQEDYNTTLQEINKKKFPNPTERTAAILAATEAFDPATALKLRNEYTQAELNNITLEAKKFEQNYAQSRAKGVDSVINWYDSVNDGFTLRREGDQIIQTDTAGNQRVFAQGTDDQIMMRMDAIAKPGGFLELAKAEAGIRKSEAQAAQAAATAAYLGRDRPRAGAGLAAEKPLTAADVKSFMEVFGDTVVGQGADRKPITLRDLPPNEAIAYINSIRGGGGGTSGLPDVPQGGLPLPGTAPRSDVSDARGLGTLGRLTPQGLLERAAAAGNPSAIAELRRRREVEANALIQTPGYNELGIY
jgi:hypothetical protein